MRLGIGSYTYGWAVGTDARRPADAMTAIDLIDRAVTLGLRVVQLADNLPDSTYAPRSVERIKRHAAEKGVSIEIGTRGCAVEHILRFIAIARELGSPVLRLVIDSHEDRPSEQTVIERLGACAGAARSAGVTIAVENHDRFEAQSLRRIVETVGPAVGICLDTANSLGAMEGPKLVVETLGPFVVNLHVKDFQIRRVPSLQGFVIDGCPAGQGRLDIPWLLQRLRAFNRDCNAIAELWVPPEPTPQATRAKEAAWACLSIAELRRWIDP